MVPARVLRQSADATLTESVNSLKEDLSSLQEEVSSGKIKVATFTMDGAIPPRTTVYYSFSGRLTNAIYYTYNIMYGDTVPPATCKIVGVMPFYSDGKNGDGTKYFMQGNTDINHIRLVSNKLYATVPDNVYTYNSYDDLFKHRNVRVLYID